MNIEINSVMLILLVILAAYSIFKFFQNPPRRTRKYYNRPVSSVNWNEELYRWRKKRGIP